MRTVNVIIGQTPQSYGIVIGRRGENEATAIQFDVSSLVEVYGDGTASLLVKRSQDTTAYPVVVTRSGNICTWTVTNTDTAYKGKGECELFWYVDETLAKSIVYSISVGRDIGDASSDPPDPYESWLETLTELAAETETNAREVSEDTVIVRGYAQEAAESAEAAEQAAESASTDAEAAGVSASNASQSATQAAASSATAHTAATTALNAANAAEDSADDAYQSEQNAADSATTAAQSATDAQTAQGKAEDAQAAAEAALAEFTSVTAEAETLPAGSEATASYEDGVLTIGVPRGDTGADGFSPTATVTQNGDVTTITVTDEDGTTSASIDLSDYATEADLETVSSDVETLQSQMQEMQEKTDVGLYGAKWDRLTNKLTRLARARDITTDTTNFCHKGSINTNYANPFDDIYPWSEMVVCDVDLTKYRAGTYTLKECITAVYGDPDFTYKGSATNFVGRYRPEFWHKSEEDADGNVYYYISQIERDGFTHAAEKIDGISFCIDDGNGGVTAGSDIPLTNIAVSQIHARAKNGGFALQDIQSIDEQIILYLVEYANMNIQNAIGDGCSSCYRENYADVISNVSVGNGETTFDITDSVMGQYMQVGAQIDIGATQGSVTYRGLLKSYSVDGTTYTVTLDRELAVMDGMIASVHGFSACEFDMLASSVGNASGYIGAVGKANAFYRGALLYANRYSYVLGIYRQQTTNNLWICPDGVDPNDYDALNTTVHEDTRIGFPLLTSARWQTVGGNAQMIPGLSAFMATGESSGSSTSPVGDQQYVPLATGGNTILLFGCSANRGWHCGVFGGLWNSGAGDSYWSSAGLPLLK